MEKQAYYGIMNYRGYSIGNCLMPKIFFSKEKAQQYADYHHIIKWKTMIQEDVFSEKFFYPDLDEILEANQIKLSLETSEADFIRFFRLIETELLDFQNGYPFIDLQFYFVIEILSE